LEARFLKRVNFTFFPFLEEEEDDSLPQPAGVKLRRAGYYTIPSMSELSTMVDTEGNLNVENFTIGRQVKFFTF
jgi:nuclear pore complex protein Nup98-Nup96